MLGVTAFGFLPGKEVKDAKVGNLGIQDRKFFYSDSEQTYTPASRTPCLEMDTDIYQRVRW